MKIIKNQKLIERNTRITNTLSIGGIIIFLIYLYYTFQLLRDPEKLASQNPFISLGLLVLSFILVQVTGYLGPKFGKSPRMDEKIDSGLKGLHSEFQLYHYTTPVSHLLVGPAGVWVILPYHQSGPTAEFVKNRWKLSGGGFSQKYMRTLGMDRLGNPNADAHSEITTISRFFAKNLPDQDLAENIKAILVFMDERIEIISNDSPVPAMKLKQLKEFIRQESKVRKLSSAQLAAINGLFEKE